jgi:ribosomal protein S18 acetylase RimI-like enzyme
LQLIYRKGNLSDKPQLQKLGLLSYDQFKNILTIANWQKMETFLSDPNSYSHLLATSTCFVCEDGDKIVGMTFLVSKGNPTDIFEKDWSYIRMIGVDPAYSGNGIGRKLTQMCVDLAKITQEKIIALHTSEFMDNARHMYESIGFKQTKEIEPRYGKKYWLYTLDLK